MELIKKHLDTLSIIGVVVGAALWMQTSIHRLENEFQREISLIKTVLIMQKIMPAELAKVHQDK